jgi:hypothetical protein
MAHATKLKLGLCEIFMTFVNFYLIEKAKLLTKAGKLADTKFGVQSYKIIIRLMV